jgi:hypothetical protein
MPNNPIQNPKTVEEAIEPLIRSSISFSDQRMLLHEMFTQTVCNAPDDEIDNFTAKKVTPFYLALLQTLENLEKLTSN